MKYSTDYTWYTSYVDTDMLWLEDSLNWDNAFELATSEYNVFDALTAAFFLNTHHFLDWFVKLSTLDLTLIWGNSSTKVFTELFLCWVRDHATSFSNLTFLLSFLFYSEFQDWIVTAMYYSPELTLPVQDLIITQWTGPSLSASPSTSFDVYQDSTGANNSEFVDYLGSFLPYVAYILLLLTITRVPTMSNAADVYATRVLYYLNSISLETRFQFEAGLQAFFFVFTYTSMMMTTFDDDQEELLEFFNCMLYYFFLFTLVYYLYKYSIHFFSYLEASKNDGKASSPFSQSLFDGLNVIAFTLRFLMLMIRLNVYDGIDDALDSYYIFMADFEEEEYFSDSFFSLFSTLSFDTDVNDDRSFLLEDEMDFSTDLFTIYFIVWGKFAYFWIFLLEEMARVTLALYVTYLLMFEINAVNRSYTEDTYLLTKRATAKTGSNHDVI